MHLIIQMFLPIYIDGVGVATVKCNKGMVARKVVGVTQLPARQLISYTVCFSNECCEQTNLTYNDACVKLYDDLSKQVIIGSRIGAVFGAIKYKKSQDLRLQIMRTMIMARDACTDASQSEGEIGDRSLDAQVNDVGDDDHEWTEY